MRFPPIKAKVCPLVSIADHGLVRSYGDVNEITLDHFA